MDISQKYEKKSNPIERANIFSILIFTYMFPIFKRAFKNGLKEEDLFCPLDEHKSSLLGEKLEKIWHDEYKNKRNFPLHRSLFKLFGFQFILLGFIKLIDEIMLVVVMPLSIGRLLSYFEKDQTNLTIIDAYTAASIIILCLIIDAFMAHPSMMGLMHLTMKLRISCSSLIYRKTLKLSRSALGNTTSGQLINLLSNDVSKFDQGFILAHFVWIGPIQTAVGIYLVYREINIAALFGMAFLLSFIPIQIWLGKKASVLRLKTALGTDERVRLMNEIISGIQVIKMYCWEKPFAKLISLARRKEMNKIRSHAYLYGIIYSLEMFVSRTSIFISLLGYVLLGNYISAEKVFSATAIYSVLRPVITMLFAFSITSIAEVNISILRIQKFLSLDERKNELKSHKLNDITKTLTPKTVRNGIILKNVIAKWQDKPLESTLKDINLIIEPNQIITVIGPVGSGKSSLLNVLLKELPITDGSMYVNGTISYSSQEPWLFSGSVRQNILFGSEYDHEKYEKIVQVCALKSDFDLFPFGDKTLVGEKGKAVSGGQKARISLARCIYKDADIYLLDDPLSAVDANVGKHLYEQCIEKFLKGKICILVTHQLQYIKNADKIVIMNNGMIEMEGNYKELETSGLDFAKLLKQFHQNEDNEDKEKKKSRSRLNSLNIDNNDNFDDGPIVEKESMESGSIKAVLYWAYLKAGGGKCMVLILLFSFVIGQGVANAGDYFISYWVNAEQDHRERILNNLETEENTTFSRENIIYIYSGLTIGTITTALFRCLYYMVFLTYASVKIHDNSFSNIIQATMRFFNTNPSGRILNRFSKDLGYVDEYIPVVLFDVIEIGLQLFGALILSAIVDPLLMVPSIFLIIIMYFFRVIYIKTSRSVKRIEGITRSPIFGHMTASLDGLTTIRAFSAQTILTREFDNYQDCHSAAWFLFIAANRCFGFWLDIICITFLTVSIFILLYFSKNIHGGDLGLIITQYFGLIGSLQWGMRQWSELENHMVSVERILEYEKVEIEPIRDKSIKLSDNWPNEGKIEFSNVNLKYAVDSPYVLKNLNFIINPKEKIGIVGRTGAGKSSTITALFQLYPIEGSIIIDNIDTTKIPLEELRSKISIIPQEPVLFSGTLRKNLDPFDDYNDDILWNALNQVELKNMIAELPGDLNANVIEGGTNFSVGQRQLICLARALIRNSRILVMDEATANVDPHTDALIQNTIRKRFSNCTVLTIAHRLHTVMDSDRILVMSSGSVAEFDHPYTLIQNEDSILYNLVKTTGKMSAINLENIAKDSFKDK